MREETSCCHMGYSFQLTAKVILYAPSHRQISTYHSLFFTPVVRQWLERPVYRCFNLTSSSQCRPLYLIHLDFYQPITACSFFCAQCFLFHSHDLRLFLPYVQAGRKEVFYLTTHSTHFIYCYMVSDIW